MNTEDLWVFKKIGDLGSKITGYRCVSTFHDFKYHPKEISTGAFDDWIYDHLGVFAYTIELWDLPTEAGIKDRKWMEWWRDHPHEEDLQILKWTDEHAAKDGYVEWQHFDHPQLGKIELGGWNNMYTWRNPPLDFLELETKKHYPYMLALGVMLPHLGIFSLKISRISDNKYHLNLVVENSGFLPSYTSQQRLSGRRGGHGSLSPDLPFRNHRSPQQSRAQSSQAGGVHVGTSRPSGTSNGRGATGGMVKAMSAVTARRR